VQNYREWPDMGRLAGRSYGLDLLLVRESYSGDSLRVFSFYESSSLFIVFQFISFYPRRRGTLIQNSECVPLLYAS